MFEQQGDINLLEIIVGTEKERNTSLGFKVITHTASLFFYFLVFENNAI